MVHFPPRFEAGKELIGNYPIRTLGNSIPTRYLRQVCYYRNISFGINELNCF